MSLLEVIEIRRELALAITSLPHRALRHLLTESRKMCRACGARMIVYRTRRCGDTRIRDLKCRACGARRSIE
jgi:hypothetical protein